MMRKYVLFLFILVSTSTAWAQTSIGFEHPDQLQPLLNYRLPDWGYSNFYLDFNLYGKGLSTQNSSESDHHENYQFNLIPGYEIYKESEKRVFSLQTNADFEYQDNTQSHVNDFSSKIKVSPQYRLYVYDNVFLDFQSPLAGDYHYSKEDNDADMQLLWKQQINLTPQLALGFGRIRNVNPMIRALRFNERLKSLRGTKGMNMQDLHSAAARFSRYSGYIHRYSRPLKYFWQDLDQSITPSIASLNNFDMFYLADVMDEAIGTRLEGWQVMAGGSFDYHYDHSRDEISTHSPQSETNINREIIFFSEGRWYHNLSLGHELGVQLLANRTQLLDEPTDWIMAGTITISWLWNLTDRVLLNSSALNQYIRRRKEVDYTVTNFNTWSDRTTINTRLDYFIENHLSLNISLGGELTYSGDDYGLNFGDRYTFWSFHAGMRYYFSRNLY